MADRRTVRNYRLGQEVQRLRVAASLSQEALIVRANEGASKPIMSASHLSRIEQGFKSIEQAALDRFIDVLNVGDIEAAHLRVLRSKTGERGWWHDYRDLIDDTVEQSIELAEEANEIHAFESVYVQALIQTESYVRATVDANRELVGTLVANRTIEFLMKRQGRLKADDFQGMKVVLTESALRHRVGSREVMRQQLRHLCDIAEGGKVALYAIPFDRGPWAMHGSRQIFSFANNEFPSVFFSVNDVDTQLYDDAKALSLVTHKFAASLTQALSARETVELVNKIYGEI